MNLFPNGKEITESFAMYEATNHLPQGFEWNNPNVDCYVVGDGKKPRTAAMFALRTSWSCFSVDPDLANQLFPVRRLELHRRKIEECGFESDKNVVIVMPHSHAPINESLTQIVSKTGKRALVTMDCCVKHELETQPDVSYADENVWSPCNTVKVWRSI